MADFAKRVLLFRHFTNAAANKMERMKRFGFQIIEKKPIFAGKVFIILQYFFTI